MPESYTPNTFFSGAHGLEVNHSNFTNVGRDQNNVTNYHGVPFSGRETGLQHLHHVISQVGALHDAAVRFPPPKCHPETRKEVLQHLSDWAKADPFKKFWMWMTLSSTSPTYANFSPIQWLHGSAGVGKSAIAQTLCENLDISRGGEHLIASFFFSRSSPTRNNPKFLFLTIAYCLAAFSNDSNLRAAIDRAMTRNPAIIEASIDAQFQELVVKPLRSLSLWRRWRLPKVVVIDGLDECAGSHSQQLVLKIIRDGVVGTSSNWLMYNIPLRFLIASRPEPAIRDLFNQSEFYHISRRTVLDDSFVASKDIALYLREGFSYIARNFQDETASFPELWPSLGVIEELVQRASGQFIYAATVLKYVGDGCSFPPKRLDAVLALPLSDVEAFTDLDSLYRQILIDNSARKANLVVQVLTFVFVTQNMSNIKHLAKAFLLPDGILSMTLRGLHSVLQISPDVVSMYHKSFADFLQDKRRSDEYHVNIHKHFLQRCDHIKYWDQFVDDQDACFNNLLLSTNSREQMQVLETFLALQTRVDSAIPIDTIGFCSGFSTTIAASVLQELKCVLKIHNECVKIRIHSFQEFLVDPHRSHEFVIQPQLDINSAACWCLKTLEHITLQTLDNPDMLKTFAIENFLDFLVDTTTDILCEGNAISQFTFLTENVYASNIKEPLYSFIIKAARQGHAKIVKFLLDKGDTAMFEAVKQGHFNVVRFLIENGVGVDAILGNLGEGTALHIAAFCGHLEIVKFLVEKGADIDMDVKGVWGRRRAVHDAIKGGGHLDIIKLLVQSGADYITGAGYRYQTTLHIAAESGHLDLVKFLLEEGIDMNVQDHTGRSAIHYAVIEGREDIVRFLVEKGAAVDLEDSSATAAYVNAVKGGQLNVLKCLFSAGANIDMNRSLYLAALNGHLDIVKFLADRGADINAKLDRYDKTTALHGAAYSGKLDIVQFLVKKGADVNAENALGQTAARIWGDRDTIGFLTDQGDSLVNQTDNTH